MHPTLRTLISTDETWKAEVFRRSDGTYGFRALRWSDQDRCWIPTGRFSESVTETAEAAEAEARARVPQLGTTARIAPDET